MQDGVLRPGCPQECESAQRRLGIETFLPRRALLAHPLDLKFTHRVRLAEREQPKADTESDPASEGRVVGASTEHAPRRTPAGVRAWILLDDCRREDAHTDQCPCGAPMPSRRLRAVHRQEGSQPGVVPRPLSVRRDPAGAGSALAQNRHPVGTTRTCPSKSSPGSPAMPASRLLSPANTDDGDGGTILVVELGTCIRCPKATRLCGHCYTYSHAKPARDARPAVRGPFASRAREASLHATGAC